MCCTKDPTASSLRSFICAICFCDTRRHVLAKWRQWVVSRRYRTTSAATTPDRERDAHP